MVIVTAAIVALVIDINLTTTAAVPMMGPPTLLQHSILHVVVYPGNNKQRIRLHYVEKKSSGSVLEETKASLEASLKNSNEPMILW